MFNRLFKQLLLSCPLSVILMCPSAQAITDPMQFVIPDNYELKEDSCAEIKEEKKEPVPFHEAVIPLGNLIAKGEGDWNSVNRGYAGDTPGGIQRLTGKTFENFTVGQVMDMQRNWLFAVGRYQFIPRTLRYAVSVSGVSHLDMFTPEIQNKLFAALLIHKRPEIGGYLTGKHNSINSALRGLAREWASVEYLGYGPGRGYYNHIGGNRAHVTWREAAEALNEVREALLV